MYQHLESCIKAVNRAGPATSLLFHKLDRLGLTQEDWLLLKPHSLHGCELKFIADSAPARTEGLYFERWDRLDSGGHS